jgi:hypothetical protein
MPQTERQEGRIQVTPTHIFGLRVTEYLPRARKNRVSLQFLALRQISFDSQNKRFILFHIYFAKKKPFADRRIGKIHIPLKGAGNAEE